MAFLDYPGLARFKARLDEIFATKSDKTETVTSVSYDTTNKKIQKTINGNNSDVVSASTLKTDMSLNNVENKSSATIRSELTSNDVITALGYTPENAADKGAANGYAILDKDGIILSTQLPSYVDDVLEYNSFSDLPVEGETSKIYVTKDTNLTYRWSGSAYVEISQSLALGTTAETAYYGDKGQAAYTHGVTNKGSAHSSDLYKFASNAEGHVTTATAVTKADIMAYGIPAVENTVSNVAYDTTNKKITKTINGTTSDVVTASTLKTDMALNNVENKSSATIRGEITAQNISTSLGYTPMDAALKGANSGVAELDANGKVPVLQVPDLVTKMNVATNPGTTDQVLRNNGEGGVYWDDENHVDPSDVDDAVNAWMTDHGVSANNAVTLDASLTQPTSAAQAKAAGDMIMAKSTQPTETTNKLWFDTSGNVQNIQVPTYSEFETLNSAMNNISNVLVKNLSASFVDGRYAINQSTNRVYETTGENRKRASVQVLPGCAYRIVFTSYGADSPDITFTDKFNTVLGSPIYGEATVTNMIEDVVAPNGAVYLFVTHTTTGSPLIEPSISQIVNIGYVDAATAPSSTLINYFGAGIHNTAPVELEHEFSKARIKTNANVGTGITGEKLRVYAVESGKTYHLYGNDVKISTSFPIAGFSTSAYNGTDAVKCSILMIDGTNAATATDYDMLFTAPSNGYIYVVSYNDYNTLAITNTAYRSTLIDGINSDISDLFANVKTIVPRYNYSFDDLFENMESSYIDDFVYRASVVDTDHVYTKYGDDTGTNAPTITTGTGITRTGASGMSTLFYSRPISAFPYYCLIGLVDGAQQLIKLYRENNSITDNIISIGINSRAISYGGQSYGNLHANAVYIFMCIDQHGVTFFDDAGIRVYVPVAYTEGSPKNIAIGFGSTVDRLFGYGSFVEYIRNPFSSLDFNRCVSLNRDANSISRVKAALKFTHTIWNNGAVNSLYYVPDDNPYMELVTGPSNNPCIKCTADYAEDAGYRTEIGIAPIQNGSLHNKLGGLQRVKASADYYMPSENNVIGGYYTYIFQLHNSNFVPPQEWPTDPPPLTVRITPDGRLMASVTYVMNGAVPAADNSRTVDMYDLGAFEMDKWMHLEAEARIGWSRKLAPKLIIRINGQERLNIDTPIGFNIVSIGGYVNTHFGIYCPEWHERTYDNMHRELLITNIRWAGTQYIN